MAPEQLSSGTVSVKSDIYSLGLILFEIFTGKRRFETKNLAELRSLHDSATSSTPSAVVDDLDPMVERVILRCLEKDPQQRPASVYAVLGALPGADPLAAALAAGETPSPEMLANVEEAGALRPNVAVACLAVFVLGLVGWTLLPDSPAVVGAQSPEVLSVRAGDLLRDVGYDELPPFTASGFRTDSDYLKRLADEDPSPSRWDPLENDDHAAVYFWRRWSPVRMEPTDLHQSIVREDNPPQFAPGSVTVRLDLQGRLLALDVIPSEAPAGLSRPVSSTA